MIRDPSDGSVRDEPVEFPDFDQKLKDRFPDGVPVVSTPLMDKLTSGLPAGSTKPEQIERLNRSREWIRNYHATRANSGAGDTKKED